MLAFEEGNFPTILRIFSTKLQSRYPIMCFEFLLLTVIPNTNEMYYALEIFAKCRINSPFFVPARQIKEK